MKKEKLILMLAVVCLMFIAGPAWALPWWDTGAPGSTYQMWTFNDNDNPAAPETDENPYGDATADITTTIGGWYAEDVGGRLGVWAGWPAVNIDLLIPNREDSDNWKEIWLEIGHRGTPDITVDPLPGGTVELLSKNTVLVDSTYNWYESTYAWHITPNPNEEHIYISFVGTGGAVDYIGVDTICVPEPMTVCLLGLGGLLLRRRKTF